MYTHLYIEKEIYAPANDEKFENGYTCIRKHAYALVMHPSASICMATHASICRHIPPYASI